MALVSQNGWTTLNGYGDTSLVNIPKIIGKVRGGDTAFIFTDLIEQFDAKVEDVDAGRDDWGFAPRPIRGGTTPSNHASGTAIDLNAVQHGLGKVGTFTNAQEGAIRSILKRYDSTVRWGGDYAGRKDEMHFEIVGSAAQLAAVVRKLKAGDVVPVASAKPKPNAGPKQPTDYAELTVDGRKGEATVAAWQILMRAVGTYDRNVDGQWGGYTAKALQTWLRKVGYYPESKFVIDGKWGRSSIQEMQKFLAAKGHLDERKWLIDGKEGAETVKAQQRYLNTQNGK